MFTTQEIVQKIEDYYNGFPSKLILLDFRYGNWTNISNEELRKSAKKAVKHSRPGGKTALVLTNDSDIGISRVLETFFEIEKYDFDARSFKSRSNAELWLSL